jgi:integrase
MSDTPDAPMDTDAQRAALGEAFGRSADPLAELADTFDAADVDPFALFVADVLDAKNLVSSSRRNYLTAFRHWRDHMAEQGRHPACPCEKHVKSFIQREREERGNIDETTKGKLRRLSTAYSYWQNDPQFPHPDDFNPFTLAQSKVALDAPDRKEPPRVPIEELRRVVGDVTHLRDRAIIVMQLKLGLRAGELRNIKLSEVSIENAAVREHYTDMGTHPMLADRENAVYIPHDREGNKSKRPRVLPLDDETRRVLLRYLLARPNNGLPWMFLAPEQHTQMKRKTPNAVWKDAFQPEYAETELHRGVTSHFGRHRFTTFWRVEQDVNDELINYMRGDIVGGSPIDGDNGAMKYYVHTYYEDIMPVYREHIYKLNI